MTTATEATPSTAVVKVPVGVGQPITDLDQAYRLSTALALAAVLPAALHGKPSDVLAIMLYGNDLGLSPMQAIQGIYVVKGKPQISGQLWTALARRAGHRVAWGVCDDQSATVTITRSDDPDNPHTETFTVQDAVRAGLCQIKDGQVVAQSRSGEKLPWQTYTKTMLRNRAISMCGKLQCPEVALGFAIEGDYDYVDDEPVEMVAPVHHGDVMPETVDAAQVAAELADIEAGIIDVEVVEDGADESHFVSLTDDYICQQCGVPGMHLTEACPEVVA